MGQLVNDAKELVNRLKEREKNVDKVVNQSNALAKRVDAIQQVWREFFFPIFAYISNSVIFFRFCSIGTRSIFEKNKCWIFCLDKINFNKSTSSTTN